MAKIVFYNLDVKPALPQKTILKQFIENIFIKEGLKAKSLNYVFCNDEYLLGINKQFLKHDDYTDIITFTLSEPKEDIEAEIYISLDRIEDNASKLNTSIKEELHRVIFHGVLHLCGFRDKTTSEKITMRKKEDYYLNAYFKL